MSTKSYFFFIQTAGLAYCYAPARIDLQLDGIQFLDSKRGKAVSYAEAHEEVVADALSTMLSDGSFYDLIMEIKVKDKGLFATIKRFFNNMIAKFTKKYLPPLRP